MFEASNLDNTGPTNIFGYFGVIVVIWVEDVRV